MHIRASEKPVPAAIAGHLQDGVAEILAIYERLYPDRELHLLLYQGNNPVWSEPSVTEGRLICRPEHLSPEYLGRMTRPGPVPNAPIVTIRISIPRPPTPGEVRNSDAPWVPLRYLRAVFALSPLLYERIRYYAEMRRKRRAEKRHRYDMLPMGRGSNLLPAGGAVASPARPAVLIGFHWLEVGGAEKLAFDCVNWALEAGLRVFVVASVPSLQRLADRLPNHPDIRFLRLDRYLPHRLWPPFLERLVSEENIRLIHIHHCVPLYESLPQLRVTTPWVRVIDSTHIVEYADGGYPRVSGVWSNYLDAHHVISQELAKFFRDRFHILKKVHLGRMLTRPAIGHELPPLNMQTGQKMLRVTFIGRLHYQKRPVVLAETLRALARWARKNEVELRGTIVGEGAFEPALQQLLQRHGLADIVEMRPADTDVPALLRNSDILLLPSNNEGLALVCYEAVEQGCIPLSTDVGSQKEIVPQDLLIPLEPRAAMRETVNVIDRLWRDPDFLARQQTALHEGFARLAAEPTAKQTLMPFYRAAAGQSD